ncbi:MULTISPECIES: hypothetical protein [unclassified Streptosporangium]|uniref:hypothetical protein n=1 Tax=Streptosporangium sp. NPDC005286 TaxID=3154463 RepID=UPI0033AC8AA6
MSVHITNVWDGLVSVELNSGTTVHLAPGECSGPIEEFETGGNQWLGLLQERGRVMLDPAEADPGRGRERRRAKKDEESPAS